MTIYKFAAFSVSLVLSEFQSFRRVDASDFFIELLDVCITEKRPLGVTRMFITRLDCCCCFSVILFRMILTIMLCFALPLNRY